MKILITENQLEKVIYNYITRYVGKLKKSSEKSKYTSWINEHGTKMFLYDEKYNLLYYRQKIQFSLIEMFNLHPTNAEIYVISWMKKHLGIKKHIRSVYGNSSL